MRKSEEFAELADIAHKTKEAFAEFRDLVLEEAARAIETRTDPSSVRSIAETVRGLKR